MYSLRDTLCWQFESLPLHYSVDRSQLSSRLVEMVHVLCKVDIEEVGIQTGLDKSGYYSDRIDVSFGVISKREHQQRVRTDEKCPYRYIQLGI